MFTVTLILALFKHTLAVAFQWKVDQNESAFHALGPCTAEELRAKDLDVVLFGATGTLGGMFAEYIASRPNMVSWGLAARTNEQLESVRQNLALAGSTKPKIIVADYDQMESLQALTKRTKVILNTAGPFERNGAGFLIKASIDNCAHYIDVAGETHWRADTKAKFGERAAERGLIITQGAGHVSLAADWLALSAARDVAADGKGPPNDVFITFTKMNGAPGGGSLASAQYAWEKYGPITDPYVLAPETPEAARVDKELDGIDTFGYHTGVNLKLGVYAGARMDCPVARLSMHIEFPGVPIKVHEAQTPDLMDALKTFLSDPRMISNPSPMMPGTHTGIPQWMKDEGTFAAEAWSVRKKDGHAARVKFSGKGDPAFIGSARMTSELAISLATNGPFKGRVGYLSPAQVVDTAELEKLWKAIDWKAADGGKWCHISHAFEETGTGGRKPRNTEAMSQNVGARTVRGVAKRGPIQGVHENAFMEQNMWR